MPLCATKLRAYILQVDFNCEIVRCISLGLRDQKPSAVRYGVNKTSISVRGRIKANLTNESFSPFLYLMDGEDDGGDGIVRDRIYCRVIKHPKCIVEVAHCGSRRLI